MLHPGNKDGYLTSMKLIRIWHAGSFKPIMPNAAKSLSLFAGFALCAGIAHASNTDYVSNQSSSLSSTFAFTSFSTPGSSDAVTFDSGDVTTWSWTALNDSFTMNSSTFGSINLNKWNSTISLNSDGSANTNSNTITLTSSSAISTTNVALNIGNLNVSPSSGSAASFNLLNPLTITGALGTAAGASTTITVNDSGALNLIGSSNAGSTSTGKVNLTFQNNTSFTLGNNSAKTFGLLTINGNTSLTQDNNGAASSVNNPNNNSAFALTSSSQATFTGGLSIAAGDTLTIYGWQGTKLGGTSSGEQLLFGNTGLVTGQEVKDVVFDLSSNTAGPTGSTYDSTKGSQYDYGEWIVDPNNSGLDELVPYAAVPEPKTILAALVILGAVAYRERRRFSFVRSVFSKPENCL